MALISKSTLKNRGLDKLKQKANELLNRTIDQHITLAVTGLSRSGKTAFITSLVNQLINEGNGSKLVFLTPFIMVTLLLLSVCHKNTIMYQDLIMTQLSQL